MIIPLIKKKTVRSDKVLENHHFSKVIHLFRLGKASSCWFQPALQPALQPLGTLGAAWDPWNRWNPGEMEILEVIDRNMDGLK